MDVLKLIESQIEEINKLETSLFLGLIFNHLDRAEIYYQSGKKDAHYYNDVVYRTNQAFEGALKEAYKVLGGKTDEETTRKTPNDIEKYFKDNNVFKERVLKLFENYRQEWRNKSTHDYKLVLDEHEAFLALINVSSFVHMLLKQVQEKIAYNEEKAKEHNIETKTKFAKITSNKQEPLVEKIVNILKIFSSETICNNDIKEEELMGKLYAFLEKLDNDFKVHIEPKISINETIYVRPDFIIESKEEKVVIEVKIKSRQRDYKAGISQVSRYLQIAKIESGILFLAGADADKRKISSSQHIIIENDKTYTVYIVG
ncbi:competence protein CoiA family protein [Hymenobacter elongatus]|uniref:Uncharacterized protein n=1 Tax=Hymenobacter elongatus TaxID=877208 RepID=A0A4Z0PQN1_9BACT|nr:hypothetical protein [Hymenobacter elongatus]TGE17402.1 hypothetical protein E5J99_07535 [Hymenobacter elongatus]